MRFHNYSELGLVLQKGEISRPNLSKKYSEKKGISNYSEK
jgi:hypothetical protein